MIQTNKPLDEVKKDKHLAWPKRTQIVALPWDAKSRLVSCLLEMMKKTTPEIKTLKNKMRVYWEVMQHFERNQT